jgi:putative lipoprotein
VRASSFSIAALLLMVVSGLSGCGARGTTPETKLFGSVRFRDPTALPAGARLEVHLDDAGQVSGSGALKSTGAATSIATQTVDAGGQRPPISFTLAVPRNALLPRHRYVLRAEVRSPGGDLLFSTPPDQPPISNPNTTGRVELTMAPPN